MANWRRSGTNRRSGQNGNNTKAVSRKRNCFFVWSDMMTDLITRINSFVWGVPTLIAIIGVGLYLSIRSRFVQLRLFPKALKKFLRCFDCKSDVQSESSFRALCTALAATVGTGNIAGVAGAIAIGGPGSIFWMWICAILGMVTKCAEATLSVHYRTLDMKGNVLGGPMYMIENGMGIKWRWLGCCYCLFGVIAAFGMGNATQINAVVDSACSVLHSVGKHESLLFNVGIGIAFASLAAVSLLGGIKRIGDITSFLVPIASAAYMIMGLGAIVFHIEAVPVAFLKIIQGAYSPKALTGGVLGSAFVALRVGASRGTFTNEAGMGTAAIAHGESNVGHPLEQGLMGIVEVFLDTIVICTMTALVILTSGTNICYGVDEGAALTTRAFACTYGEWVCIPIALFLCCFAFATMLGWGMYGLRCAQYLFGNDAWMPFVLLQAVVSVVSVLLKTGTVWMLAEIVNGLMAIPNLICLAVLSPQLLHLIDSYEKRRAPVGALQRFRFTS